MIELTSDTDLRRAWPVLAELRSHLDKHAYMQLLGTMRSEGYRLFALDDGAGITALAGVGIGTNFYYGKYLWVYDLVTTEAERSSGRGASLMRDLENFARTEGCDTIALASGLHRKDAHRFYEDRLGYERASYTFRKTLGESSEG
ncbi:MAG: GNAT family N-acetyltransferase [Actinomycetota bacterium]|nr:GNAT family N-acetyltransferase [Actinomycetota bacterium]